MLIGIRFCITSFSDRSSSMVIVSAAILFENKGNFKVASSGGPVLLSRPAVDPPFVPVVFRAIGFLEESSSELR
jgi:hypothetical protein